MKENKRVKIDQSAYRKKILRSFNFLRVTIKNVMVI